MRKEIFAVGEFYHLFNRGVDKRRIFMRQGHYMHFLRTVRNVLVFGRAQPGLKRDQSLALNKKLSFICYALLPNHYHILVRQIDESGITEFMHRVNTSYTKYLNLNVKRSGRLFEYTFKAVHVQSEEQLVHLSRYIHLNPLIGGMTKNLNNYQWSSYQDFIGKREGTLCTKEEILTLFSKTDAPQKYEAFVLNQIDYAKKLDEIKHLTFE